MLEHGDHRAELSFCFHDVSKLRASDFASLTCSAEAFRMMGLNSQTFERGALDWLGRLDLPAVVLVGDDGFICSAVQAARIHLRLRGSKLVLIEEAGHFLWLEQPDAFWMQVESRTPFGRSISSSGGSS